MGAQLSKGGAAVEGTTDPKANGQENGHVKTNGDISAKPDDETVATDGNGTAEAAKEGETSTGDPIEPVLATEGEAAKAEGDVAKEGKKKKFSLKNSFKFKGISLKKSKKGSEEAKEDSASPTAEDKPEENSHAAKETKDDTPCTETKEGDAATDAAAEGEAKAVGVTPPTDATPDEGAVAPEGTTSPQAVAKAE
ncbi:MARCKS-related protein 1-A [Pholidichthys leucotaenia]